MRVNGVSHTVYILHNCLFLHQICVNIVMHDDVIKWKHLPRYWPFMRGIHRSLVNSPHKGQWRGALMFSLICARINGWVNNGEAGDLGRHRAHCDVTENKCYMWHYGKVRMRVILWDPCDLTCHLFSRILSIWLRYIIYSLMKISCSIAYFITEIKIPTNS